MGLTRGRVLCPRYWSTKIMWGISLEHSNLTIFLCMAGRFFFIYISLKIIHSREDEFCRRRCEKLKSYSILFFTHYLRNISLLWRGGEFRDRGVGALKSYDTNIRSTKIVRFFCSWVHGKKILSKIAWTRILSMHSNFAYFSITPNLKQIFESMRLEYRSFTRNESKTSLL